MASNTLDQSLFNIDIIAATDQDVKYLGEITNPNIFEASSNRFDKAGLFSTEIFGPVGSPARNTTLGYINLKVKVLHPYVFQTLCTLNSKYEDIIAGKKRAKLDRDKWDLVEDNSGETGYEFFMSVLPRIRFSDNGSNERKHKINLIKKYANEKYMSDKYLVLPAGLRDYRVDESGRPTEDEVNALYRKLLAVTALLKTIKVTNENLYQVDPIRYKIQKSINSIFDYFLQLLGPKSGFIQNKWSKRAIVNGTRNVLTPAPYKITKLNNAKISTNHSVCGIYQYIKAIAPIAMNRVKGMFINRFLNTNSSTAMLVDPNTKKTSLVNIKVNKRDEWLSMEGLNRTMNKMKQADLRFEPVMIDGYYLQMVYDDGQNIVLLNDTKEITSDMNKEWIRPLTYIEMFYISIFDIKHKYPGFITRYPVISLGGIFPCKVYVKTTYKARDVKVTMNGRVIDMDEYPILGEKCMESTSMPTTHLAKAGADFDGDSCLGEILCKFNKKIVQKSILENRKKDNKISIKNKRIMYNYGLINLENFPRGKLIKSEGNKDFYEVPKGIEVLTSWNGKIKWVKPESYSVHKNLKMLRIKTTNNNSIECSSDHTLVTLDENLNYKRSEAKVGMAVPRINNVVKNYINKNNFKRHVISNGMSIPLNNEIGYLIGVIIGDGWVNKTISLNDIMLASVHDTLIDKVTLILSNYGYVGKPYSLAGEHVYRGYTCHDKKTTWRYKPIANMLRKNIGLGAENKHLPSWWGNTTEKFRWGLLSGLIDTDGSPHVDSENRFNVSYNTSSRQLAYEVIGLVNSLGGTAYISWHKRDRSRTIEYKITISPTFYNEIRNNLTLVVPHKAEVIKKIKAIDTRTNVYTTTPNIRIDKLEELKFSIRYGVDKSAYYILDRAIRKGRLNKLGGYLSKDRMLDILIKYWELVKNDPYWIKLRNILEDENISWEVITDVFKLPEVTEAYDLTTPPYCTFVLQNGIIVYDTVSLNIVYTEDAIKEINELLNSNKYYLSPEGSIAYSADDDVIGLILKHMTDKPSGTDISKE